MDNYKDLTNQSPFWANLPENPKYFLASTISAAENTYLKLTDVPYVLKHPSAYQTRKLLELSARGLFGSDLAPTTSVMMYVLFRYWSFFKSGLKVYIPAHLVILLLRLRGRKESLPTLLKKYIVGLLRSSIFVATFAFSYPAARAVPLFNRMFNNKLGSWSAFIVSVLFTSSIFLEASSRWSDISLYVLGQWLEGYGYSLVKRKYIGSIPHLERIVFALAISMIISLYYSKDECDSDPANSDGSKKSSKTQDKISKIVKFMLGDDLIEPTKPKSSKDKENAKLSPSSSTERVNVSV